MTRPPAPGRIKTHAGYALGALIALNLLIHIPFLHMDTFGESDAARVALVSLQLAYHKEGPEEIFPDPIYSAPLYAQLLHQGLTIGLIRPANIIAWMTTISYFSSAVITALVFIIMFNLTGSILAASGAGLLLQFNPTFWFNSIYGFPTILAIAFLFLTMVIFQMGISQTQTRLKAILVGSAFVFFIVAILIKIDAFLAGVILCVPVWQSTTGRKHRLTWLAALAGLALGSFWLYSQYTRGLFPGQLASTFYGNWNLRFPIDVGIFFSGENLEIIFRSVGIFSIPLAVIAIVLLAKYQKLRSVLFWLAVATLIMILFWGVRKGNSARHNLMPAIFLVMFLALPLSTKLDLRWGFLLALMCIGNYFLLPPQASTISPTGRLVRNSMLFKETRLNLHSTGRAIANIQEDKIAVTGYGWDQPYYVFELFMNENYTYINAQTNPEAGLPESQFLYRGQPKSYLWSYNSLPPTEIVQLLDLGYFVLIGDPSNAAELEKITFGTETRWLSTQNIK